MAQELALVGAWGADIQGVNNPEAGDGGLKVYRIQNDGRMELVGKSTPEINIGSLTVPGNGDYIYATDERKDFGGIHGNGGGIAAYKLNKETGEVVFLNEVSSAGAYPCYITGDSQRKYVFTANHGNHVEVVTVAVKEADGTFSAKRYFDEGSVVMFPIQADGSVGKACDVQTLTGFSVMPLFQWTSHPHSVWLDPTEKYLLVGDKGTDLIRVFEVDYENGKLISVNNFKTLEGLCPRHIAFHPNLPVFYCNGEQDHTVHAFGFDDQTGNITYIGGQTTVGPDYEDRDDPTDIFSHNQTADLRVHKSGKYLYVSNRGDDSIASFKIDADTGMIQPIEIVPSGGAIPRAINFDKSGDLLYVVNQRSNLVVPFKVDELTGHLIPTGQTMTVNSPVNIQFTN